MHNILCPLSTSSIVLQIVSILIAVMYKLGVMLGTIIDDCPLYDVVLELCVVLERMEDMCTCMADTFKKFYYKELGIMIIIIM